MAITVTATQGGSTANGMVLRVFVLTQAAATQNGATANVQKTSTGTYTTAIVTTQTGSRVYGASSHSINANSTAAALTTVVDDIADGTNAEHYVTFKATSLTGTPGSTTLGYTTSTGSGPMALAEILTAGTLTEDGSGPAAASTTAAITVTTASFTPPAGSLLVALTGTDGGTGVTTMTVSDTGGGYTWVEQVKNNPSGGDYAGVWLAQVPAAGAAVTFTPQRYGQAAPPEPAVWAQRDRRDANTVATAANPLVSPLDSAWQADAAYWHLYADDALRDRRAYFTQPRRVSDPAMLQPAGPLDPTLAAADDTARRYRAPAYYDRRLVPQQKDRRDANTVGTPAPVIDPTTSAHQDRARRYGLAATHVDRRLVPAQRTYPDRQPDGSYAAGASSVTAAWWSDDAQGYTLQRQYPGVPAAAGGTALDPTTAAADDTRRRYGLPATHADRRLVPQQRAYPDRQPDGSYTAGASYVTAAWWSADAQGWNLQRQYFPVPPTVPDVQVGSGTTEAWWGTDPAPFQIAQRRYVSDPSFTPPATVTAGAGTTQAWWSDDAQGWTLQRTYPGVPAAAVQPPFDPTLGAWPVLWLEYNRAATHTDRREVPQQRAYVSDPSFYPTTAPTDPLTVAWGAGGGYWHLYNRAADAVQRWWMPQQRAYPDRQPDGAYTAGPGVVQAWWSADAQGWNLQRQLVSDPAVLASALLEGVLLGGAGTALRVLAAAYWDRRQVPQQRQALVIQVPPVPFDPVLGAFADLARRYGLPFTHADRRQYPQQRLYWPLPAPPPPFTIGALSATDAPTATQAPTDRATNALTALSAPSGALTARDQRTGGPG